jgi:predicted nucleic acid-binding protein
MPAKVVDASALAAVAFNEPDADQVAARLDGGTLAAPPLMPFELASACLQKLRRHPDQREVIRVAYARARRMDITQTEVDLDQVLTLAEATTLSIYDAAYLWLAEALGVELVTLDVRLAAAYRKRRRSERDRKPS